MVGIEWDMIALVRDIYCRLVLGQTLQFGGQGSGMQQPQNSEGRFEQAKSAHFPLQGGGVRTVASKLPQLVFASLPGVDERAIQSLNDVLKEHRASKSQVSVVYLSAENGI